ncbi:nuclear transport factor 2 family protein [Kineosporia rhizophila]|uniref:nuclear transport factor 2 family protein n=1 Tax=Kineosporia TaxID=49184 RepID=UPI000AB00387|nr:MULTISPECIES: nuclear transport factor 2 family protein [Kineosporia]MCE0535396.1 nuclear transport factor 2 family protein [Kineosporia rhizophila]GLY16823.1 hypothetical protein Kisp01_38380 [Kineosporia sp. NBRC 101677]
MTIEELMHANLLEVFGERDAERRRAAIERTCAPDVRFSDPQEVVVGRDALSAKAQKILDEAPGFVFSPAAPAYAVQNLGHLAWNFGPQTQPPIVRGIDIALVENGLIASFYTLLLND